jgi:hypothetical protein
MANTFELIASSTVGAGGAASIDFSSIPNTYTDLCLEVSLRSVSAGTFSDNLIKFNTSTASFTNKYIYGNGATANPGSNAYAGSGGFIGGAPGATATSNTFSNGLIYIPNYAGSNYKPYSLDNAAETNATTAYVHLIAGLWSNTAAITQITLVTDSGANYAQYSSAYLYGIKNS